MATYRQFAIMDDNNSGGTSYDELVAANTAIPVAPTNAIPKIGTTVAGLSTGTTAQHWPVTGGSFDPNLERIDRNAEARGRRAVSAPLPFRARPGLTVPLMAYRTIVEKVIRKTIGNTDAVTGSAPTGYTHKQVPLKNPSVLPAVFCQLIRDNLNTHISGGHFNRFTLNFPMDGEGTVEVEIWGLYHNHTDSGTDTPPTTVFTGLSSDPLVLRDALCYFNGATVGDKIPDLQGLSLTFNNNLTVKPYAGQNIASTTFSAPGTTTPTTAQLKKIWFPQEFRLSGQQDVTFSLQFGDPASKHEIARDFSQIYKLVFECAGNPVPGATAVNELLRITMWNAVYTGGGSADLAARDDLVTSLDGVVTWDETVNAGAGGDVQFETLNDISTPIT